jgi:hypothetical protein
MTTIFILLTSTQWCTIESELCTVAYAVMVSHREGLLQNITNTVRLTNDRQHRYCSDVNTAKHHQNTVLTIAVSPRCYTATVLAVSVSVSVSANRQRCTTQN